VGNDPNLRSGAGANAIGDANLNLGAGAQGLGNANLNTNGSVDLGSGIGANANAGVNGDINANRNGQSMSNSQSTAQNRMQFHNGYWWYRLNNGNWVFHRSGQWFNTNGAPFLNSSAAANTSPNAPAERDNSLQPNATSSPNANRLLRGQNETIDDGADSEPDGSSTPRTPRAFGDDGRDPDAVQPRTGAESAAPSGAATDSTVNSNASVEASAAVQP
jgi:hypothetical protein